MKFRKGFVSNSSSCSFIIKNKTEDTLTVKDFAEEVHYMYDAYIERFYWHEETKEDYYKSLENEEAEQLIFPGDNCIIFGDSHGPFFSAIFDYMLREGGDSERFEWSLDQMLR